MMNFGVAAGFDVFAAGAVAGFAAGFAGHRRVRKMDPRVRAGGKFPDDLRVAIHAGLGCRRNARREFPAAPPPRRRGGTGIQKQRHVPPAMAERHVATIAVCFSFIPCFARL